MVLGFVYSRTNHGISAPLVRVEAFISSGLPRFDIVGLAEKAVRESSERVRCALHSSGFIFPSDSRITINLSPADLPKHGGRFDLAIALSILLATDQAVLNGEFEFFGELGFDGSIRAVRGCLPAALECFGAKRIIVAPHANIAEIQVIEGLRYVSVPMLAELVPLLNATNAKICNPRYIPPAYQSDLAEIKGQQYAKRALEVAASGGHHALMVGAPGCGKTMLAQRLPSILPPLTMQEKITTGCVYSVVGEAFDWSSIQRPFRGPHHSASSAALVGGTSQATPGEISLAHNGVLFLDEATEYPRKVLDSLREPLESGEIVIARAHAKVKYPARFQFIAAMNPCPCGYLGTPKACCRCSDQSIDAFRNRLSAPLLDRIDIQIEVVATKPADIVQGTIVEESSAVVRERVLRCWQLQQQRQGVVNAQMSVSQLEQHCKLDLDNQQLLIKAMEAFSLSTRGYSRIVRVARTIADMAGLAAISKPQLIEAMQYRRFDTNTARM